MFEEFGSIDSPSSLKKLDKQNLKSYSEWLRNFLIEKIAANGGHFAANLGVVELTVALHYVYDCPKDILIWDVGHQSYAHKVLTGRKSDFDTLRKLNGISGFPKMSESPYDAFGTAHSSTSISAVLGYARAAALLNIEREHIAVIGDGSMSAGQAFEALNNSGTDKSNITIIINDNHIGIDPSQGALGEYLEQLEYKSDNLFTDFGFTYFGPVDGHDVNSLTELFEKIRNTGGPKVVHVRTTKGKGYAPAEQEQTKWHSTSEFDKLSGKNLKISNPNEKFQDVFGKTLLELARNNDKIVAVTPAMVSGSSLHHFQAEFPERVFDVGIAEQHAVTFSAGLAASGMLPFCCIYSTFLQRGYDQLIHDVALQNLPVIFAVDRAGIVGEDGPTHHGMFDVAFLNAIPNLRIFSPSDQKELRDAMHTAIFAPLGPVVIRYPRGHSESAFTAHPFELVHPEIIRARHSAGSDTAVLSYGTLSSVCEKAAIQCETDAYSIPVIKPLPTKALEALLSKYKKILFVEETQKIGGIGASLLMLAADKNSHCKIEIRAVEDHFVTQGSVGELIKKEGLDEESICKELRRMKNY